MRRLTCYVIPYANESPSSLFDPDCDSLCSFTNETPPATDDEADGWAVLCSKESPFDVPVLDGLVSFLLFFLWNNELMREKQHRLNGMCLPACPP